MTTVTGIIKKGAGIVSGRTESVYGPEGTLSHQIPLFEDLARIQRRPLDLSNIFHGSMNVDLGDKVFEIIRPDWYFNQLHWFQFPEGSLHPSLKGLNEAELREALRDRLNMWHGYDVADELSEEDLLSFARNKIENFSLVKTVITTATGREVDGYIYYPDPATKGSIFHGSSKFEVIAPQIPENEVCYESEIQLTFSDEAITISDK